MIFFAPMFPLQLVQFENSTTSRTNFMHQKWETPPFQSFRYPSEPGSYHQGVNAIGPWTRETGRSSLFRVLGGNDFSSGTGRGTGVDIFKQKDYTPREYLERENRCSLTWRRRLASSRSSARGPSCVPLFLIPGDRSSGLRASRTSALEHLPRSLVHVCVRAYTCASACTLCASLRQEVGQDLLMKRGC